MAYNGNEDLQMTTRRQARVDYELLNGGPDSPEGVLPSDQITESDISQSFHSRHGNSILPLPIKNL